MFVLRRAVAGARLPVPEPRRTLQRQSKRQRIQIPVTHQRAGTGSRVRCRLHRPTRPAPTLVATRRCARLSGTRAQSLYTVPAPLSVQSTACAAIRDDSPYIRFHRCVFRTIGWLEEQRAAGTPSDLRRRARAARPGMGGARPDRTRLRVLLPRTAESMVASMVDVIAAETGTYDREEWIVDRRRQADRGDA